MAQALSSDQVQPEDYRGQIEDLREEIGTLHSEMAKQTQELKAHLDEKVDLLSLALSKKLGSGGDGDGNLLEIIETTKQKSMKDKIGKRMTI